MRTFSSVCSGSTYKEDSEAEIRISGQREGYLTIDSAVITSTSPGRISCSLGADRIASIIGWKVKDIGDERKCLKLQPFLPLSAHLTPQTLLSLAYLDLPIPERDVSYCKNEYYRVVAKDPVSQNREI